MLVHLSIRDIVLIERLDLALGDGLSVLTGETGAGKSILLDALALARYRSYRGGHKLNAMALQALLADETAHEIVEMPERRRDIVRHSPLIAAAVAAPAYGPQTL